MNHSLIKAPTSPIIGEVGLPASKSISNRVLLLNALGCTSSSVINPAKCDDTEAMIRALSSPESHFDIGAAGTTMRFLTAYLANSSGEWTITGSERMKQRPILLLVDALNKLGADISYMENEGYPPLRIKGRTLRGGAINLKGGVSSQYISALLMIAPLMTEGLRLQLDGEIISRPYIDLTLALMQQYGVNAQWEGDGLIAIEPQQYKTISYSVESDWSAASYWFQLVALGQEGSNVRLRGLIRDSLQGDSLCAELFERLGVKTIEESGSLLLVKGESVAKRFDYDFVEQPDLAQTFATTCVALGIPFHFTGLQSLRIKETDRIAALQRELRRLGYQLEDRNDSELIWDGSRMDAESDQTIRTYHDHRMAMAFAPLACRLEEGIAIADPSVVTKSYPDYWTHLEQVGFEVIKNQI